MAWREFLLIQSKRTTALKATWQQVCCDMGDLTENRDPADVTDAWRLCPWISKSGWTKSGRLRKSANSERYYSGSLLYKIENLL